MRNHTELINFLIEKNGYKNYLEIGVQRRENNFDRINVQYKIGVDPDPAAKANFLGTSDEFFAHNKRGHSLFDIVFIDGLHHADQVQKDFRNSFRWVKDNGLVVLHDTNPESVDLTSVPRGKSGRWLGDVYRFICALSKENIQFNTLNMDNGCTVVSMPKTFEMAAKMQNADIDKYSISWEEFDKNRSEYLHLISPEDYISCFKSL